MKTARCETLFRTGLSAVISENYGCSATIILLAL